MLKHDETGSELRISALPVPLQDGEFLEALRRLAFDDAVFTFHGVALTKFDIRSCVSCTQQKSQV